MDFDGIAKDFDVTTSNGSSVKVRALSPRAALLRVPRLLGLDVNKGRVRLGNQVWEAAELIS
jgi:hypothetical protein